jgi:hypothetical protein
VGEQGPSPHCSDLIWPCLHFPRLWNGIIVAISQDCPNSYMKAYTCVCVCVCVCVCGIGLKKCYLLSLILLLPKVIPQQRSWS